MEFKPFKNQVYQSIKQECLHTRRLFEDPEFLASDRSLFRFNPPQGLHPSQIKWLRPAQICSDPKFEVSGFDPKDLHQGSIGNCWFIAGAINISTNPKYLEIVVPRDQSFDSSTYTGAFHFRFWQFGDWIDVVVDDRLPVVGGKLCFCSNRKSPSEFWGPLLEKAYAKLAGCYEFLDGGFTQDAIVDMTAGVTEYLDIQHVVKSQSKESLWKSMLQSHTMGSLTGANINPRQGQEIEGKLGNGLIVGHAYSITKVVEISPKDKNFPVVEEAVRTAVSVVNRSSSRTSQSLDSCQTSSTKSRTPKSSLVKRRYYNPSLRVIQNLPRANSNISYGLRYDPQIGFYYDFSNNNNNTSDNNNNNYNNYDYEGGDYDYYDDYDEGGEEEEDDDTFEYDYDDGGDNFDDDNIVPVPDEPIVPVDPVDPEPSSDRPLRLVRLRNPWGDHHEWKGAWGDGSAEWKLITVEIKQQLGLVYDNDGEFWMSFSDFASHFDLMCTVHVNLHAFMEQILTDRDNSAYKWDCKQYHGEWIANVNAGGSGNPDQASFWTNPQYLVSVTNNAQPKASSVRSGTDSYEDYDDDRDNNTPDSADKATLIVSLMCKDSLREANRGEIGSFPKQFRLFRVKDSTNLSSSSSHKNSHVKFSSDELERVGSSHMYSQTREVSMRFRLAPGNYVIIPSTYDKNVPGKFLLRLFTETNLKISDVSLLDVNAKHEHSVSYSSRMNFNEIEDKLFDQIGGELHSDDFSVYTGTNNYSSSISNNYPNPILYDDVQYRVYFGVLKSSAQQQQQQANQEDPEKIRLGMTRYLKKYSKTSTQVNSALSTYKYMGHSFKTLSNY